MAMAFAPLALKVPITILDANVVTKSYRNFWKTMQQIGFQIKNDKLIGKHLTTPILDVVYLPAFLEKYTYEIIAF